MRLPLIREALRVQEGPEGVRSDDGDDDAEKAETAVDEEAA